MSYITLVRCAFHVHSIIQHSKGYISIPRLCKWIRFGEWVTNTSPLFRRVILLLEQTSLTYMLHKVFSSLCETSFKVYAFSLKLHVSPSDPLLLRQYSDSLCNILQLY